MHRPTINKTAKKAYSAKALCLTVSAVFCLSACGIKGDLKRPKPIFDKSPMFEKTTTTPPLANASPKSTSVLAATAAPSRNK